MANKRVAVSRSDGVDDFLRPDTFARCVRISKKSESNAKDNSMLTREEVTKLALEGKERLGLTWPKIGEAIGRNPVYAAMLAYGYGQATAEEADGLVRTLSLPADAEAALQKAPHRTPAQPWPPTDPFIYRFFEVVMLYGPVFKDVAHELFGDGIMSAIDMSVDIKKIEDPPGVPRMVLTLNGKWLQYKKF